MPKKSKNKKVVVLGGGTGNFTVLRGLKKYNLELSAVVSMADDGGSTGILRDELGVLPPGDVRQCLVALSDSSRLMRSLMNYRFENGSLQGHSFGNLLLSALEKVTGSFEKAVEEVGKIMTNVGDGILINAVNNKIDIYSTSYQSKSLFTFNYDFGNTEVSAITWKCHKNYGSLLFGEIGELVRNELKYKLIVVKVEMSMKTVKLEIDPTKIKAIIEFDYAKAVIICNDGFYMISLQ